VFTPALISSLSTALSAPSRAALAAMPAEQREKEDAARVSRQRPILRVCSELALVGIITDGQKRSGGEWIMKVLRELVGPSFERALKTWLIAVKLSNDPTLSSLPLLSTFLKSYSRPYLGLTPPQSRQISAESEPGTLSSTTMNTTKGEFPALLDESEELVEQDIRDRFKRMCEGYFDSVSKKLVIEHKVRLAVIFLRQSSHPFCSACKIRIGGIMKHISGLGRSLKTGNKRMRR